mgnify:CR=1 FL=1
MEQLPIYQNQIEHCIQSLLFGNRNYLFSLDIGELDVLLIKDIYVFCATRTDSLNLHLLNRIWTELELSENTFN